ncbi:hypothetical protein FHW23_001022 [Curtobacterium pusillum]|uniref:Integral membrane protein n=1 Tax=Curtobacterium pusillum TaxID=69373 RepID=A0AAW3T593_9MICO|nr:hypothetical protein [Curtobacterium pusillum]MBA8989790.1 hypothetical protein [Curtobacterium pusillum]
MFKLGWQVFRTRFDDAIDRRRFRRAAWISAAAATLVLIGLVVLQVVFGWAGDTAVRPTLAVVLVSGAAGLLVFACFPKATSPDPAATINGRPVRPDERLAAREPVQPYFGVRPRPVESVDREAVLTDVPLVQRALIRRMTRFGPLALGVALLGVTAVIVGGWHILSTAWTVVYVFALPGMVRLLGRTERARLAALAAPAPPEDAAAPRASRRRDPPGSKIRLPGE